MYYCDMEAERFLNYKGGIFYDVAVQKNDGSPVGGGADTDDAYACGGGGSKSK